MEALPIGGAGEGVRAGVKKRPPARPGEGAEQGGKG